MKKKLYLLVFITLLCKFSFISELYSKQKDINNKNKIKTYESKNDTLIQKLEVEWESRFIIKFTYTVKNIKRNQEITIKQTAKNKYPNQDPEIDEDDITGDAYPSEEYLYEIKNCAISIRIELNKGNRAIIESEGCKDIKDNTNTFCPVNSPGILRSK